MYTRGKKFAIAHIRNIKKKKNYVLYEPSILSSCTHANIIAFKHEKFCLHAERIIPLARREIFLYAKT